MIIKIVQSEMILHPLSIIYIITRMHPHPNIFFISMGGMGNMLFLTTALQIFSHAWPKAKFHFLVANPGSRAVIEKHPQTGTIISLQSSWKNIMRAVSAIRALQPSILFSGAGTNPLKAGMLGLLSSVPLRLGEGFRASRFLWNRRISLEHDVQVNARLARKVAPGEGIPLPKVWVSEEDTRNADRIRQKYLFSGSFIGMHAGSDPHMTCKRWPEDRFRDLASRLKNELGIHSVFFGGAEESDQAEALARETEGVSLAGKLTVRETFLLMQACRLFVSNDSGPMHLAAAAGVPVVAIFGPTAESRTGPWGQGHTVIQNPVACRPCYHHKPVACHNPICLNSISTDQVFEMIRKQWR